MRIEGNCLCGKTGYEARIDPERVILCHCTDCQTVSSAPYRASVPVLMENFKLRTGEPKIYVKTAESGNKIATAFCGDCGTALYSSKLDHPTYLNLRLGAVRERGQLVPKSQGWCRSAQPWAFDISRIPQIPDSALPSRKS